MNKFLVLSFTIFVLISLSSSQSTTSMSPEQLNQLEFLFQLGDIQAKIWAVSMKVANNVTDSVARELKQIAEKMAPILTRFNITINATLSINPAQCKNDVKILLTQARNLFTTAPYKLETFKKFLNFVYVSLAQLILDCTGVNIITQIVNSPPVVSFYNGFAIIKCGATIAGQVPGIVSVITGLASLANINIPAVVDSIKRASPILKTITEQCDFGIMFNEPTGDQKVTQDSCIQSIKNAKDGFKSLIQNLKDIKNLSIFSFPENLKSLITLINPIFQQCKAFAKRP